MKTLSGTVKLLVLVALVVLMAVGLRGFAQSKPATPTPTPSYVPSDPPPGEDFVLIVKPRHLLKKGEAGEQEFIDLLNGGSFPAAKNNRMHLVHSNGNKPDDCLPAGSTCSNIQIKTDAVTASRTAQEIEMGELTVIQPHVTIQVCSKNPADIEKVLLLLAQ